MVMFMQQLNDFWEILVSSSVYEVSDGLIWYMMMTLGEIFVSSASWHENDAFCLTWVIVLSETEKKFGTIWN